MDPVYWIPDESEDISFDEAGRAEVRSDEQRTNEQLLPSHANDVKDRRDYDVDHYLRAVVTSYASRLHKAYTAQDFEQLFRVDEQLGLFDCPVEDIEPIWIRCQVTST